MDKTEGGGLKVKERGRVKEISTTYWVEGGTELVVKDMVDVKDENVSDKGLMIVYLIDGPLKKRKGQSRREREGGGRRGRKWVDGPIEEAGSKEQEPEITDVFKEEVVVASGNV